MGLTRNFTIHFLLRLSDFTIRFYSGVRDFDRVASHRANSGYKDQNMHINQNFTFRVILTLMEISEHSLKKKDECDADIMWSNIHWKGLLNKNKLLKKAKNHHLGELGACKKWSVVTKIRWDTFEISKHLLLL